MVKATLAFAIAAAALMVVTTQVDTGEAVLWVAAQVLAALAICTAFGAITIWARRRKRLWG